MVLQEKKILKHIPEQRYPGNEPYNRLNADKGVLTADAVLLDTVGNVFVAEKMWKRLKKIK